jgi:hypothetical protein
MSELVSTFEMLALRELVAAASPAPWRAMVEGRDHEWGDSFIRIGDDDRQENMYVVRDTSPARSADLEFLAAARNAIPKLLDEIDRLRGE